MGLAKNTHYILLSVGSLGDMYPFMSLAKALQGMGRKVTLIGSVYHEILIKQADIPFKGIGTRESYLKVINNPGLWDARTGFSVLMQDYAKHLIELQQLFAALPAEPYVIICHPFTTPAADLMRASQPNTKVVGAYLAPSNLRSLYDPLVVGPYTIPTWLPLSIRKAFWRLVDYQLVDPIAMNEVNVARSIVGLLPIQHFIDHMQAVPDLTLTFFPAWFAKSQADWPQPLLIGNFPLYEPNVNQALSPELITFLQKSEAPILFTPGSGNLHAAEYFKIALQAVKRLNKRAIFLTAHQAQLPENLPPTVLWQSYIPLRALLSQVAMIIHHGGIGTTAEALNAGIPQLIVPFAWDQFDNAARIKALAVGDTVAVKQLTVANLSTKLLALLTSQAIQQQCQQVAQQVKQGFNSEQLCIALEQALNP